MRSIESHLASEALRNRVAELESQLAEARKDRETLSYLIANRVAPRGDAWDRVHEWVDEQKQRDAAIAAERKA